MNQPQITSSSRPSKNPRLAHQELGQKAVILHYENRRNLGLNETGTRIWSMLNGTLSLGEIADKLAAETQAPRSEIEDDLLEFVAALLERDLVTL